jgi:hypothetical protein
VPGQQRQRDRESPLREIFGPGAQRLRRTGESVTEEDADLSALVAERLGSRKDRHRGLLFVRLERERKGECKKDYFTVRDRTDTDQGRHRSRLCFGPVPGRNGGSTTG